MIIPSDIDKYIADITNTITAESYMLSDQPLRILIPTRTYLAVALFPDPPCGEIMEDFSDCDPLGCKPTEDVCVEHDSPLICRHGCKHVKNHQCKDQQEQEKWDCEHKML